ncbi:hypothetical protein KGA65_14730 [Ideonella sp. B7]|uniref:hypothetical protein n=1 Tax=Ideonella benzenivorans TaxID=2831643 RepID=UPI001CEC6410|nr:hypothetical protein [Ideonella benzenivorans]MCA6217788.1 hypothetical protein [Ideonella benzenivorans]
MTGNEGKRGIGDDLTSVALIDARTAARVGSMSLSWWHAEVAARRAPQPVIRRPRCTRWSLADVRAYWAALAEQGAQDTAGAARLFATTQKATAAAIAKRAKSAGAGE